MTFQPEQTVNELVGMLARGIEEPGNLSVTLKLIAQTAQRLFSPDLCIIFAVNPITGRFPLPPILLGERQKTNEVSLEQLGQDRVTQQILEQEILVVKDLEAQPEYQTPFTNSENIRSFVGTCLYTKRVPKPLAILYLAFRQPHQLSDTAQLRSFVNQASIISQNTWLLRCYQEVARIDAEINQELENIEILFEKLWKHISGILDINHFFMLATYQPQTDSLDLFVRKEKQYLRLPNTPMGGTCQQVLHTRKPLMVKHLSEDRNGLSAPLLPLSDIELDNAESFIYIPLLLRDVPLGVLSVQSSYPDTYDAQDLRILDMIGNQVSLALSNMRLFDNLSWLNETGQFLTQQLEAEQVLQRVVDRIRNITNTDVVVLYPYDQANQRFVTPPRISGELNEPELLQPRYTQPRAIAPLTLRQTEPIFAKESVELYQKLGGENRTGEEHFTHREAIRSTAAMPLRVGDEPVGVLFVNFRQEQRFDAPQQLLIESLASYAAIAIKNSREFDALADRHSQQLEIIQKIDQEIRKTLNLQQVLDTILKLATDYIRPDRAAILLYEPGTQTLKIEAVIGYDTEANRRRSISLSQEKGITGWVFKHKKSARVDNVHNDPEWHDLYIEFASDTLSELDVPLVDDESPVGVINFESTKEAAFSQADQDFLETLAGQAVLAIKNAQDYEREKRIAEELAAIKEIGQEIVSHLKFQNVLDIILDKALQITQLNFGHILLYDKQRGDFFSAAERGVLPEKSKGRFPKGKGLTSWVMDHKQLLNVDVRQPPWSEVYERFIPDVRWELVVPLLEDDEPLGVIIIVHITDEPFTERDERLLTGLADLAVIAIQNAERYEKAEQQRAKLKALYEVDQKIIGQLDDPNQVMHVILENTLRLTKAQTADLHLYEQGQVSTTYFASIDDQGYLQPIVQADMTSATQPEIERGIIAHVAKTRKHYIPLGDAQDDPYYVGDTDIHSEIAVPLLSKTGELVGILNLESCEHYVFDDDDLEILKLLVGQAVIAIQDAYLFAQTQRHSMLLQTAAEVSKAASMILDQDELIQQIVNLVQERFDLYHVGLFLVDQTGKWAELKAGTGEAGQQMLAQKYKIEIGSKSMISWCIINSRARLAADVDLDPIHLKNPVLTGTRSELDLPLISRGQVIGAMSIQNKEISAFSEDNISAFQTMADQLAVSIENASNYTKAQEESQRFQLLHKAGQKLGEITGLENLQYAYKIIGDIAEEHSQSQVIIRRYDANAEELVIEYMAKEQEKTFFRRMRLDEGINGQVAQERRMIVLGDAHNPPTDVRTPKLSDPQIRSLVITPIQIEDHYYGNLVLAHGQVNYFEYADVQLIEGLARQLAVTIHRLETVQAQQEAEKRLKEVEAISSIGQGALELAHRLGNYLGLVRSYANNMRFVLQARELTEPLNDLEKIVSDVQQVLELSTNLKRKLGKFDTEGKLPSERVVVSVRVLLEEAAKVVSPLPPNVQLELEISQGVALVYIVHSLITDALHNLVINAVEAIPKTGGKITLRAYNAGRYVHLEVVDTGTGIPPDKLPHIFTLFYSTKGSSGFGLWSARHNTLANGGEIYVKSEPGRKTIFTLALPRV